MKVEVLLPKIFNFSFTYDSNGTLLKIGDIVSVPFGKSKAIGVFIGLGLDFSLFDWFKETEINDYEVL